MAEKQLDDLQKLIIETLKADILLLSTGALTLGPDDTWPARVETFRQELDGQGIRGKTITWTLLFSTN